MRTIQTSANPYKFEGQTFTGLSQTLPDLALTPKMLLENHTRGIMSDLSEKIPVYNPDHFIPDPRSLDLTDIYEMKQDNHQSLQQLKNMKDAKHRKTLQTQQETSYAKLENPTGNGVEPEPNNTANA